MTNWSRARLKEMARIALHGSYWKCVLAGLLMTFCVGTTSGASTTATNHISDLSQNGFSFDYSAGNNFFSSGNTGDITLPAIFLTVFISIGIIAIIVRIFLIHPLEVGCCAYFNKDLYRPAELSELNAGFSHGYLNIVKIMFFRELYVILWSFLFVIPGIVKSYEYRMIPYLLSENPNMSMEEAFARSRAMMDGEKWNSFLLDWSFIGWEFLSTITFGIFGLFYVNPYQYLTNAALYGALKQKLSRMENMYRNPNGGPYWQA